MDTYVSARVLATHDFSRFKSNAPGLNIETIDGKKWFMAFTDLSRMREYAKARNQPNVHETVVSMALDPTTSFDFLESNRGIAGVCFNYGKTGFCTPMGNLRGSYSHLVSIGRLPAKKK